MSPSPHGSASGTPSDESSRPVRHLYLVEIVLGAGLLLLFALIFLSGNPRDRGNEAPEDAHANIVKVTAANWHKEVENSAMPVVVDFWAPWCGPCRMIAPMIAQFAEKYAGQVQVCKVNIDQAKQLAAKYATEGIPTVCIFNGGAVPRRTLVGVDEIEASLGPDIDRILKDGIDDVRQ